VPRVFGDDADRQTVLGISAGITVLHVHFRAPERREHIAVQFVEIGRVHRAVHGPPGDVFFAARLAHEKFVLRRPPGVLARPAHERPLVGHQPFAAADRFFVQRGRRQIPFSRGAWDFLEFEGMGAFELGAHLESFNVWRVSDIGRVFESYSRHPAQSSEARFWGKL
jgi:hypothetical protein